MLLLVKLGTQERGLTKAGKTSSHHCYTHLSRGQQSFRASHKRADKDV